MELQKNLKSIVHTQLFPGPGNTDSVARSEPDEKYMLATLQTLLDDPYFGNVELTRIKSRALLW